MYYNSWTISKHNVKDKGFDNIKSIDSIQKRISKPELTDR